MKNNNLFILMAAVFALISCGTANRSAYYNGSQFRNSIYYTPDSRNSQAYLQEQQQLQQLQQRTEEATAATYGRNSYDAATDTRTVYVGDNNEVDISYVPGTTYTIVDDPESYEARLRKFDSPTYTINIDFDLYNPYPWYNYRYGWYTPYHGRWYPNWSHPWYSSWYSWHSPSWWWNWDYRWNWHYSWSWYDPFYDPWWGHAYIPGYAPGYWPGIYPGYWPDYRPGYHPGHYPGHGPGAKPDNRRDVYYGQRTSTPTYRDAERTNVGNRPHTGSVTRRPSNVTQINKGTRNPDATVQGNSRNERPQNQTMQQGSNNQQYRRVAPKQGTKGSTNSSVNKGQSQTQKKSATATYNRNTGNSSSYNRSSSSQQRSSSFSSGSSSRSSGTTSSGSSGSSYRRR